MLTVHAPCSYSQFSVYASHSVAFEKASTSKPETGAGWEQSYQNYTVAITWVNFSQVYVSSRSYKKLFNCLKLLVDICSQQLLISLTYKK